MFGGHGAFGRVLAQHDHVAIRPPIESQLIRALQAGRIVFAVLDFALHAVVSRLTNGFEHVGQMPGRSQHRITSADGPL